MRTFFRRATTLAVLGTLAVVSSLPAVAQSGRAEHVSHRQSILTELSPTGEPGDSTVFTQLTVQGNGPVTVSLPDQSTRGLRSLDGFGGPSVNGDEVVHTIDASGPDGGRVRTMADSTAELPVSVSVVYLLDGQEVAPGDLAGADGNVEVRYTVRNLTAEPTEIVAFDAENNRVIETMDVAVPMVGTLSLTLPPTFANIDAPGAVTAGDGRGNTVINFSLLLFEPLGSEEISVAWSADSADTVIPETSLQVLPVDDQSFGSLASTADAYKGASESLTTLANGALIINSNLQLLGSGAAQLLDGLGQLADGAEQLNDGLANTAAPGAGELSDGISRARSGADQLADGLGELASGATRLSAGQGDALTGARTLSSGLGQLAAGATQLSDGLGTALAGSRQLEQGFLGLPDSVEAGLRENLGGTLQNTVLPQLRSGLADGLEDAIASNMADPLEENLRNALQGQLAPQIIAGLEDDSSGLEANLRNAAVGLFLPEVLAGLEPALAGALQANVTPQVAQGVRDQVPALLVFRHGIPPEDAQETANILAGILEGQLNSGFVTFAEGFAPLFGQSLQAGLIAFSNQFATGFLDPTTGFPPALLNGFGQFSEVFAPQFSAGFADQFAPAFAQGFGQSVSGSFDTLTDQFSVGFASGLEDTLNEEAFPGFRSLNSGLAQLNEGAGRLAGGGGDASSGSRQLVDGLQQLADGGAQLAPGARRAADGSAELADGLRQLDEGSTRLADGLGDAADGSGQIADGLGDARDGGERLADGTVALQEGFEGQLIAGVSGGRLGASQDYEQVRAVIARGREGAFPYGVASGADATAVYQFDLAGVGDDEGPGTGLLVGLAVLALAAAGGLGFALRRTMG